MHTRKKCYSKTIKKRFLITSPAKENDVATFFMFGKYSYDAVKEIHPERTTRSVRIIEALGGKVIGMYAICGDYDLILILELPGLDEAIKASVQLYILTGIHFSTFPAVAVNYFDVLIAKERKG